MSRIKHLQVSIPDQISKDQIKVSYPTQLTDRQKYDLENRVSKSTGKEFQQYYVEFKNFYVSANISSNCNDITFINLGSNPVTIASAITLQQNQSLQISGNVNELDVTEYPIQFSTYTSPNNNLLVLRKLYR